jgi:hypothetical protein
MQHKMHDRQHTPPPSADHCCQGFGNLSAKKAATKGRLSTQLPGLGAGLVAGELI